MSKMVRCDRCRKADDWNSSMFCAGMESVYFGHVTQYRLGEMADIHNVDLCAECQAKLDKKVRKFMNSKD